MTPNRLGVEATSTSPFRPAKRWPHRFHLPIEPALIIAATTAAYANSFHVPFLLDDELAIQANPTLRSFLSALHPPADSTVTGRPILNLSFAFNHALGGGLAGDHAVNLIIHLAAALTLYWIIASRWSRGIACAVALIWALHPLQTEAVTYISQRAESLMGLFYLLTLLGFVRGWRWLSWTACLLGMGTKEPMMTAPLVVLLFDRTFVAGSFRAAITRRRWYYAALAATWVPLAWLMAGIGQRGVGFASGAGWQDYAAEESRAIWHYVRLAAWPHPLVFDYGTTFPGGIAATIAAASALAAAVAALAFSWRRWPIAAFAGTTFLLLLAPTSSFVPIAGQPVAEHRMYLPMAVLVAFVVIGVARIAPMRLNAVRERSPKRMGAMRATLIAALVLLTYARNRVYGSAISLWTDTVARAPNNARAQNNLGQALQSAGWSAEAIGRYREAIRLDSHYAEAHSDLAAALAETGHAGEAIDEAETALRLQPDFTPARYNLANALRASGRPQSAIAEYRQVLKARPNDARAWNNLGICEAMSGDLPEATGDFESAVRCDPNLPEAEYDLGCALRDAGRLNEAEIHLRRALRIKPDYAKAVRALKEMERAAGSQGVRLR